MQWSSRRSVSGPSLQAAPDRPFSCLLAASWANSNRSFHSGRPVHSQVRSASRLGRSPISSLESDLRPGKTLGIARLILGATGRSSVAEIRANAGSTGRSTVQRTPARRRNEALRIGSALGLDRALTPLRDQPCSTAHDRYPPYCKRWARSSAQGAPGERVTAWSCCWPARHRRVRSPPPWSGRFLTLRVPAMLTRDTITPKTSPRYL
jgi:hypothetical protein